MMTRIRHAANKLADRRVARRLYRETAHLDDRMLKDIGLTRGDWAQLARGIS